MILWPQAKTALDDDEEATLWLAEYCGSSYESFPLVDTLDSTDGRRMVFMDPKRYFFPNTVSSILTKG